jgi:conjugal transfer ATP-binding protein TraC
MFEAIKDKATAIFSKVAMALGEGDHLVGQSKARRVANESVRVSFAEIKTILPYETERDGIFFNRDTLGFGFEIAPKSGADEAVVTQLASFIKSKIPSGVVCEFKLFKHGFIGDELCHGFSPFIDKGGVYKTLAQKSFEYNKKAIHSGYKNNANISANLCDYKVYVFFSTKKKDNDFTVMSSLQNAVNSELKVIGFSERRLNKKALAELLQAIATPDLSNLFWPKVESEAIKDNETIANHCVKSGSLLSVNDDLIELNVPSESGNINKNIIINCKLQKYPKTFSLWQTPDLFSNLYKAENSIACPFMISFSICGVNQSKMRGLSKHKSYSLQKNNNAVQNFINPYLKEEVCEWSEVSEGLAKDEISLYQTCYNLMLFTDEQNKEKHVSQAADCYKAMGFELQIALCSQWLRYLINLPFMGLSGIWNDLKKLDEIKKLTSFNIANMLPIIADYKGSRGGMLMPTYRNQLSFIDTFSRNLDNYNYTILGTSGSGKSNLSQKIIVSGLARGEKVFVIDLGDSYKHLCQTLGGIYVDASTIALNPFTLFDFEGEVELDGERVKNYIQIRDLIALMASPNEPLKRIEKIFLLDAVLESWNKKGNKSCIDDVVISLKGMLAEHNHDNRLKDLIKLLTPYTKGGIYGHIFNGETPLFNKNDFVVFELGALEDDDDLLAIVMYVMIVIIQGQFYHSPREIYKRCHIDEAWRIVTENDNPFAAKFVNQGYRTARKYLAGFGMVAQGCSDTSKTSQGQAIVDSSSTNFILYQKGLTDYVNANPNKFNKQQQDLLRSFGSAKAQGYSSVMVQMGEGYTFHRSFVDPYSRVLFSTEGHEYEALEKLTNQGKTIEEATALVANHYYGDEL